MRLVRARSFRREASPQLLLHDVAKNFTRPTYPDIFPVIERNVRSGLATRKPQRRTSAPTIAGALFLPAMFMAVVRGRPSGLPVSFVTGSPTCVRPPPFLFGDSGDGSITKELPRL